MTTEVTQVLENRGKRYGAFVANAEITGAFLRLLLYYSERRGDDALNVETPQFKALLMIITKFSRILNGDPEYLDNWVDIAGYAQLVVNHLQKPNEKT
jgi:hypothetical protein